MITSVLIIAALALGPAKSLFQQQDKSGVITDNTSAGNVVTTLQFDADSAYAFTAAQCDFGPRNMNSDGHDKCKKWIISKFRSYGCEVMSQDADLRGYDGTMLKSSNIIARHRTDIDRRIMLCAHWDSRPWADNDPDPENWHKPILAANDAASGVAVMIEIARLLQADSTLNVGIDFVCFDAEDWGTPQWEERQPGDDNTWALGAQYFAQNMPLVPTPQYGILLDMVGGENATFYREVYSLKYARDIVDRIWDASREVGQSSFFIYEEGGQITDDHVPLNTIARIPTADIIPFHPNCRESSFGSTWHTLADDMSNISRNTLKAVGQTVLQVLSKE